MTTVASFVTASGAADIGAKPTRFRRLDYAPPCFYFAEFGEAFAGRSVIGNYATIEADAEGAATTRCRN
jgi:hypothetical protein